MVWRSPPLWLNTVSARVPQHLTKAPTSSMTTTMMTTTWRTGMVTAAMTKMIQATRSHDMVFPLYPQPGWVALVFLRIAICRETVFSLVCQKLLVNNWESLKLSVSKPMKRASKLTFWRQNNFCSIMEKVWLRKICTSTNVTGLFFFLKQFYYHLKPYFERIARGIHSTM